LAAPLRAAEETQPPCQGPGWSSLGSGKKVGVSGMVSVGAGRYVVVHDAKDLAGRDPRLSWAARKPNGGVALTTIAWPWEKARLIDGEAITRVPASADRFLVLGKEGATHVLHHVRIQADAATWLWSGPIYGLASGADMEAFAVRTLGWTTVGVWADRGGGKTFRPATLYFGTVRIDPSGPVALTTLSSVEVTAPYPKPTAKDVRGISDLVIDGAGMVWATSASDSGDAGPFASALYGIGRIRPDCFGWTFDKCPLPQVRARFSCKVEGLDVVPDAGNRFAFGTDDEDLGGSVRLP
jgi:hypothetical protein